MTPSDALVRHVVDTSVVMRLATMSAAGHTSVTPLWFVEHDGRLVAGTAASTVAARNVAANPDVTVLLDGELAGRSQYVVRLRARGVVHHGLLPFGALRRAATKYYLAPPALRCELRHAGLWPLRRRYYAQAEAVWIAIEPTHAELLHVPGPGVVTISPGAASRRR